MNVQTSYFFKMACQSRWGARGGEGGLLLIRCVNAKNSFFRVLNAPPPPPSTPPCIPKSTPPTTPPMKHHPIPPLLYPQKTRFFHKMPRGRRLGRHLEHPHPTYHPTYMCGWKVYNLNFFSIYGHLRPKCTVFAVQTHSLKTDQSVTYVIFAYKRASKNRYVHIFRSFKN